MNEQIKRLAEQAGFVLWGDEDWNPGETIDWASNYDQEIVKYTELVVDHVFDTIKQTSEKYGVVLNEELRQQMIKELGLDDD